MSGSEAVVVDVWRLPLDPGPGPLSRLARTLSTDEHERAKRFRFDRDRRRFVAARGFLRTVLGQYLGSEGRVLTIGYESHGKPFLTSPFAADLRFNIAHSGEVGVLAVARGVDVGVDIEVLREVSERQQLAVRFFAPSEAAAIDALPDALADLAFFTCWTRKEAYIKATGMGLSQPLDEFEVSVSLDCTATLLRVHGSAELAMGWCLHDISRFPNYAAAIAVRAPQIRTVDRHVHRELDLP